MQEGENVKKSRCEWLQTIAKQALDHGKYSTVHYKRYTRKGRNRSIESKPNESLGRSSNILGLKHHA